MDSTTIHECITLHVSCKSRWFISYIYISCIYIYISCIFKSHVNWSRVNLGDLSAGLPLSWSLFCFWSYPPECPRGLRTQKLYNQSHLVYLPCPLFKLSLLLCSLHPSKIWYPSMIIILPICFIILFPMYFSNLSFTYYCPFPGPGLFHLLNRLYCKCL